MAIKDQCEICRKRYTDECTETIVYDGISCSSYSRGINLEKDSNSDGELDNQVQSPVFDGTSSSGEFVFTSDYLKENTSIHGWLSFLLLAITLGGIISAVYSIMQYNPSEFEGSKILALGDVVIGVMLLGVAIYSVYSFIQRKPNAVFLGKTYIVAVFATNLLSLFGGDFESSGYGSVSHIVRSLIWAVIWFSYLCLSEQVQEVIPKEYRKLHNSDYYLLVALIIVPLAFIGWGIKDVASTHEEEMSTFLQETPLRDGEYTDGKVIFSVPKDFNCEVKEANGIKVYTIENDEIGSITLCSDFENDQSEMNINDYWTNWENEEASGYRKELIVNEKREVNGYPYYFKVTRYEINDSYVYWRFIMLFDNASSKVCVISTYDGGYDSYIEELLNNIRFH
ncbi:MAG: DUF2569 family protein [Prevotella sp.]|nr:DUF2569 family protein [Prevotella sp.]